MSSYQKFTLQTIKDNLKSGKYKNATGANRAVGKTQELSESDKVKAKALIAKHFGVEAAPVKKAPAKKTPKKAAPKKAPVKKAAPKKAPAKKAAPAKAPAKKAAPTKAAPAKAPKAPKVAKAIKPAAKGQAKKAAAKSAKPTKSAAKQKDSESAPAAPAPVAGKAAIARKVAAGKSHMIRNTELIAYVGQIVQTLDMAIKTMETARAALPKGGVDEGVATVQSAMTKAVQVLNRDVLSGVGLVTAAAKAAPATKAAPAAKPAPVKTVAKAPVKAPAKAPPKKGKVTKEATPAVSASSEEDSDFLEIDQDLLDNPNLTDDERRQVQLVRIHKPAVDREMAARGNGQRAEA